MWLFLLRSSWLSHSCPRNGTTGKDRMHSAEETSLPSQNPASIVSSVNGRTEHLNSKSPQSLWRTLRYCLALEVWLGSTSKNDKCLAACCNSFFPSGCGFCKYPVKYLVALRAATCMSRCRRPRVPCAKQLRLQVGSCVSSKSGTR